MNSDSGHTQSIWMDTAEVPEFPALVEDIRTDVCVVGAGIAGLMTAWFVSRDGKRVVVIDDGPVGGGETGRTTAHLVNAFDDRYYLVEQEHGERAARLTAESHTAAIDALERIVREEGIDCDFRRLDGYLFLSEEDREKHPDILEKELKAARDAGVAIDWADRPPIDFGTGRALRFRNQAQFHPLRFLGGLATALANRGVKIYTRTHAESIEGGPSPKVKTSDGRTITARAVCVCTNSPISDYVVTHIKSAPYRTFVIAAKLREPVPVGLYWDTPDPYHYVRLMKGDGSANDYLIVGGEDHKTGQKDDALERFRCLEEWTRERFPQAGEVKYRWSGQVLEPADALAFIGPNPDGAENVYIATGDSGNGMTHGPIAGMLLADLIEGRRNAWSEIYDPKRVALRSAPDIIRENVNVAVQYADWLKPGEAGSVDDIPPGEGAIVRRGLHRVAAYRDEAGNMHERSATCTHLRCSVRWNSTEKSWDCPCHGSRFDPYGNVLNGPALKALGPAEPEHEHHEPRPQRATEARGPAA